MVTYKRLGIVLLTGLAVIAILLLSAGISGLELQPGKPLRLWLGEPGASSLPPASSQTLIDIFRAVWQVMAILCVVLLPVAIIQFIISPEARKRIIRNILRTLGFLLLYYLLAFGLAQSVGQLTEAQADAAANPVELTSAEFVPPSDAVVYSASVVAVILAVVIAWLMWRKFRPPPAPLQEIAHHAQAAIDDLRAGSDLKNTVIRCYYEMSRALSRRQGIQRRRDMTPREFEMRLADAGLPITHVHRLTRLFEAARYSPRSTGEREEREALECLTAIADIFGRTA